LIIIYLRKRARVTGGKVVVSGIAADSKVRHMLYASLQRVAGGYGLGGRAVIVVRRLNQLMPMQPGKKLFHIY
jgi:hypothetical protein